MPQTHTGWRPYAVRMANEGLPIGAIARALAEPGSEIREVLTDALQVGKILEMPPADWPPTAYKSDRVPVIVPQDWLRKITQDDLTVACCKVFKLTPLQATVFALLLRHKEATKEMIHFVIEQRRQLRNKDGADETEIKMVDVVICHIRRRLKKFNHNKPPITTLWGSGYYVPAEFKKKVVELINTFEG